MGRLKQLHIDDDILEDDGPRGPGDPDYYGYPGEPPIEPTTNTKGIEQHDRANTNGATTTDAIPF